jgi:hypothetical protein
MSAADLVLSRDEVRALTRTPIRARQVDFLCKNGIRHYVDGHGWPVVLRATVEGATVVADAGKMWKSNKARA